MKAPVAAGQTGRPELAAGRAVHAADADEQDARGHEQRQEGDALGKAEQEHDRLGQADVLTHEVERRPSRRQGSMSASGGASRFSVSQCACVDAATCATGIPGSMQTAIWT